MTAPFKIPPHHAFPEVTWADLQTELRREIENRRATFPRMVAKGQIAEPEAKHQQDLFQAILEDCRRFHAAVAPVELGQRATNPADAPKLHGYSWRDRRAAITRELEFRQRLYPGWIKKGQITQADADLYTRRLTCMRALYELGYDWTPSNGVRPHFAAISPTHEELDSRDEWQAIENDIAARDGQAQEALAL